MNYLSTKVVDFNNVCLRVETTNRCNFKCTFCSHWKMKRSKGDMSSELYNKVIREASSLKIDKLEIRSIGEPLLDMHLEKRIDIAYNYGFRQIFFTTNGFLLTKERYLSLCQTKLSGIVLSLSPKQEFELTRGVPFESVMNNLIEIKKVKMKVPITISIITSGDSSNKEFLRLGYDLMKLGYSWLRAPMHNWAQGEPESHDAPCARLWDSFTVNWDGTVPLCCLDFNGAEIMGDVSKHTVLDIINSPSYKAMRKRHILNDHPIICKSCNYLKPVLYDTKEKCRSV